MVQLHVVVALLGICVLPFISANAQSRTDLNLTSYGLDDVNSSSCGDARDQFVIDRLYDSQCFSRRVYCDATGDPQNATVCEKGYTYIADDDPNCYHPSSAEATAACAITIMCGLDGISVYIGDEAVFNQSKASLQFGINGAAECMINHTGNATVPGHYQGTLSFEDTDSGPTDAACGVSPTLGGSGSNHYIQYNVKIMRYLGRESLVNDSGSEREEVRDGTSGAVITREKCFMIDAQCNYNPDGTVTASYQPSTPNAIDEHAENTLIFAMKPINCSTGDEIDPQTVFVEDKICYVNKITTIWHSGIRISSTKCWATPSSDPYDPVFYQLTNYTVDIDSTFGWICNGSDAYKSSYYEEAFGFYAFRFQSGNKDAMQDVNSYAQTVHIHCEVNACDVDDETSTDCKPHCNGIGRSRRAVSGDSVTSSLTKTRTFSRAIVMPKQVDGGAVYVETPAASYNFLSDTLSLGLFAVGCVFGVVALGLFVITKRQSNTLKYRVLNSE
ncbi:uncharacterized protein LOC142339279 isoform X2 [Convolutriloba macropyga]|uniref:uncharacterized protein LOC142339279 isoform X2 n=1 Tax=Convolutriloba macropyga TaxID=536237 RepID=UPI003F523AD2